MNYRSSTSLLVVFLLLCSLPLATATTEYAITSTPSVDTPERTVQLEGTEYTVSSVGRVTPGSEFQVETSAPSGSSYDVYLYDGDRNIVDAKSAAGDDSVRFSTEYLESGSYVAAIYGPDGNIRAIQPVVVAGYRVNVSAPDTVPADEQFDVSVSLQKRSESAQLQAVEIVVVEDGSLVERTTASETDGAYTTTVSPLDSGQYSVYAVARNQSTVRNKYELIGISDTTAFRVTSNENQRTPTATESDSTGESGGETDATATATSISTRTGTPVETSTARTTTTRTTPTPDTTTEPAVTSGTPAQTASPSARTTATEKDILTPHTSTATTTATQTDGPWLVSLLILLAAAALIARVR